MAKFTNPVKSVISLEIGEKIRAHHLLRAKQVLAINQNAGRFPKLDNDYETFIGRNIGPRSNPNKVKPPQTKRRNISTVQSRFLPFPARIYFTHARSADLYEAFMYFLNSFSNMAPVPSGSSRKGHSFSYRSSLVYYFNNTQSNGIGSLELRLKNPQPTDKLEIINIAPHSSRLEYLKTGAMYKIALLMVREFGPSIQIGFNYINSDKIGMKYSRSEGGPTARTAKANGRAYPVVYALPMLTISLDAVGRSNSKLVTPGKGSRNRAAARRKAQRG